MSLSIQNLTKQYGDQYAINDISFEIETGEIVGFLGPNGAGKSTTMKIITCFISPTSGTVSLDDYNIFDHPLEIRKLIGYLPEHNPLYLDMYVHEFLDFVGKIYEMDKASRKKRIAEVIELTGLGREQHKKIQMLSKGYRQRVGLAQALFHEPQLLILDEPTSGLDPNQIIEIRNLIKELGKDKTVIFSSHILSEVEAIADRVIIINEGQIVADEATHSIQSLNTEGVLVEVEFEQAGFSFDTIQQIEGVQSVEALTDTTFQIRTLGELDIRKAVFTACVTQGNVILAMSKESFSLEDAFRKLTN